MATELRAIAYDQLFTSDDDECHLGHGSFSQVYRCYHNGFGDVAVKILDTNTRNPIRSFNKEGTLHLKANSSDHILTLHGLCQAPPGLVGLVLEYMPYGSLANLLMPEEFPVPWTFRLRAMSEVASAVNYLHHLTEQKRLIHCDLKVENILLNGDLHAKIGDFGGATLSNYTGATLLTSTHSRRKSDDDLVQYTLSYSPPELLGQFDTKRTPEMDTYSFAIVLYVVTTRSIPFAGVQEPIMIRAVERGQRPQQNLEDVEENLRQENDTIGKEVFRLFNHLMSKCWAHSPKERMNMQNVRDSLLSKLKNIDQSRMVQDILQLKQKMTHGCTGKPANPVTVHEKYKQLRREGVLSSGLEPSNLSFLREVRVQPNPNNRTFQSQQVSLRHPPGDSQNPSLEEDIYQGSQSLSPQDLHSQRSRQPAQSPLDTAPKEMAAALPTGARRKDPLPMSRVPSQTTSGIRELEASFSDPYLRVGNIVRMITDVAAIKNAQIGHGGWEDFLTNLRDMEGKITKVEDNGDVAVTFSSVRSHRFNPNSLVKIPSHTDLHVGDFVGVSLDKDLVAMYQEGHGGWVNEMEDYFDQPGLIFRFLPDRDVLVVYKNGMYFRFNPEVLCKTSEADHVHDVCLQDNPSIKIGDYVCHDLEDELIKNLQENCGGWNSAMSELRGRVGKFVYADYHGRAFVAYSSKLCFVFNPGALTRLNDEEALRRFRKTKEDSKKRSQLIAQGQVGNPRFSADDTVRVCLPLDIVIELQRGHGGWCYQMLEVYGLSGVVKAFDEGHNAQVLFDTGNKWTFNPASLERIPPGDVTRPPVYVPPFRIGDKVKVRLKDLNNASLNKMRQAFRMLDIPEDKVEILMKTGEVLGIDDDVDVIVSFGDGKNYGLKPEQLEKL